MTTAATLTPPADWRLTNGAVPLSDVARTVESRHGFKWAQVDQAVRAGLIPVESRHGKANARYLTVETAVNVLAAAAVAALAGIALGYLLRLVSETGGKVTAEGLVIPLPR